MNSNRKHPSTPRTGTPYRLTTIALAAGCVLSCPVAAQTEATASDSTVLSLGQVVITDSAGPLSTRKVLTSVNVVPTERIEDQIVSNNWQLFDQVPGVMLTQFGQGTTSGKLSLRGFNGEGEINAVKLLIDGVPSNSNDGNMPYIDLAPRLDIDALEVVRGTNDPRYGMHNIAGNANIVTKWGGNYTQARASAGSYGRREVQAALGRDSDGMTQNYAIGYQAGGGFRDHSDSDGLSLSGKWGVVSDDRKTRVGLIARHYTAKAQEAGYLTATQAHDNPSQSPPYNATDEDKRRVSQLALQAESSLQNDLYAAGQVYANDLYDRRFVKFSATVSQQERFVAERHIGASANLTWRAGATAVGDVSVNGGVDTEHQDNRSERYNTSDQLRVSQTRDQQFDFNTVGGFVQAVVKPSQALKVVPALRVDQISGSYTNRLTGIVYDVNNYGLIPQPKLSAVYSLSEQFAVYGNWGRTFQVGVGTASYKINQTNDLSPSINDGWEAGVKFHPASWLDGRVAAWQQTASNEARRKLNDPSNASENIGKTLRQGLDIELNARPSANLGLWAAAALQRSEILQADAALPASQGKEIDHVPHLLYNLGVDYQPSSALRLSTWVNGQSNYFLERTNSTGEFGDYVLLNASARYALSKSVSLELQVRNLTDHYYEYVWHDGVQSLHSPGAPRSVFASVTIKL